jgi:tetratricopeptide (TPR) repeat protein
MPLATRIGLIVVLLAVAGTRAAAAAPQNPPMSAGDKVALDAMRLRSEGKAAEAVTLLERFLARSPDDAGARLQLAGAYNDLADAVAGDPARATERQRHLQNAATQYERLLPIAPDRSARVMIFGRLSRLNDADHLNRPTEAEAFARRMVQEDPSDFMGHVMLSQLLQAQGRYDAAADALRAGHRAADLPPLFRLQLAQFILKHVSDSPAMPAAAASKLLAEARAIADEIAKGKEDVRMALMAKSMIVKEQANREPNANRQKALLAEAERIGEQAMAVNNDGTPRVKTVEEEWNEAHGKAIAASPDGTSPEVARIYEQFLKRYPDHAPARTSLAQSHQNRASAITDRTPMAVATRTQLLERALATSAGRPRPRPIRSTP